MHGHQLKQVNMTQSNQHWHQRREQAIPRGIARAFPIFAQKADSAELWDIEGKRYIDFAGGIVVLNTGRAHPKITAAVEKSNSCF